MRRSTEIVFYFFLIIITGAGLACADDSRDWPEFEQFLVDLEEQDKYDEALAALLPQIDSFPAWEFEVSKELAYLYLETGQPEKNFAVWEAGHMKGYFYLLNPRLSQYVDLAENETFLRLVERDAALRDSALAISQTMYEVFPPVTVEAGRRYPLVIVLHGGGRTMKDAQEYWLAEPLRERCIMAFVQSYRHYDSKTFGWRQGDERTHDDIRRIYREIVAAFPVDTTRIVIGGISAGGTAAADIAFNEIIPVHGYLGICPGRPRTLDAAQAGRLRDLGMSVVIIGGETDFYLPQQREMTAAFDSAGFAYEFTVIPGMGHQYPDDFRTRLEAALTNMGIPAAD